MKISIICELRPDFKSGEPDNYGTSDLKSGSNSQEMKLRFWVPGTYGYSEKKSKTKYKVYYQKKSISSSTARV